LYRFFEANEAAMVSTICSAPYVLLGSTAPLSLKRDKDSRGGLSP
jgi:hypothetical protein